VNVNSLSRGENNYCIFMFFPLTQENITIIGYKVSNLNCLPASTKVPLEAQNLYHTLKLFVHKFCTQNHIMEWGSILKRNTG
jgi:hypothetical protein